MNHPLLIKKAVHLETQKSAHICSDSIDNTVVTFEQMPESDVQVAKQLAKISLPNEPSVALPAKFGLRKLAQCKEIGCKFAQTVDASY